MARLCRLCSLPSTNSCHLFTESPLLDCHHLLANIKLYIGLNIQQEDTLPTQVCWNCVQKVSEIEMFVKLCLETQEKLDYMFSAEQNIKEEGFCEENEDGEVKLTDSPINESEEDTSLDTFADPSTLLQQQLMEGNDSVENGILQKYSCPVCNRELAEKSTVKKHLEKFHNDTTGELFASFLDSIHEVPRCRTCGTVCQNNLDLFDHNKMHESASCPKTVWNIRHKSAMTIETLQVAIKRYFSEEEQATYQKLINEGKDQEIYCKLFGNIFASIHHSKRETKSWVCRQCEGGFFTGKSQHFEAHFASHEDKNVCFACELCSSSEPSLQRFQAHLKKRHFVDVKCEYWGDIFESVASYGVHTVRVHDVDAVQCPYCEKTYSSEYNLKSHISRNHDDKIYVCSLCAKDFKSQEACKAHEKIHSAWLVRQKGADRNSFR